ncbi:ABC transporter ATP-binding protein [Desulfonatronovibrio magnus]|uniref:ABC transporter ATP-binding protein n=1 Tax=Desulfonatronovibrio magnus TaxID=698827 RepID=UPI0005EB0D91|nr:ABC transporter ATP-binding protein [Desulfonatronovibrio magnus]
MNAFSSQKHFLLKLIKITHFFDLRLVFKNVSLTVMPGTVTLIAGPNGAGKTTLMNIISGLIAPSDGVVEYNIDREQVAYLGHSTFIYPQLTALDNLKFWARLYYREAHEKKLTSFLDQVGLKAFAYEKAGTFSRGMAQRLTLARVLMIEPQLMLLDEPGTGLDINSREMLRREITACSQKGAAVVWVSHTLDEDLEMTDQVIFLDNKQAAFSGLTRDYVDQQQDN